MLASIKASNIPDNLPSGKVKIKGGRKVDLLGTGEGIGKRKRKTNPKRKRKFKGVRTTVYETGYFIVGGKEHKVKAKFENIV